MGWNDKNGGRAEAALHIDRHNIHPPGPFHTVLASREGPTIEMIPETIIVLRERSANLLA